MICIYNTNTCIMMKTTTKNKNKKNHNSNNHLDINGRLLGIIYCVQLLTFIKTRCV